MAKDAIIDSKKGNTGAKQNKNKNKSKDKEKFNASKENTIHPKDTGIHRYRYRRCYDCGNVWQTYMADRCRYRLRRTDIDTDYLLKCSSKLKLKLKLKLQISSQIDVERYEVLDGR